MTEPYTGLPALGVVAMGFIIFAYLMLSTYSFYASSAYYSSVRAGLLNIALTIARDPALTGGRPGIMDACLMDNATGLDISKYGYPGSTVRVSVEAPEYRWSRGGDSSGRSASCRLPVSLALSDARCVPGTLTVTMWAR